MLTSFMDTPIACWWWCMPSVYTLCSNSDNCPPCLISFEQRNVIDNELPHRDINSCSLYLKINNFTICNGTFLSNNFFAGVQWFTLSNTFFGSRKHKYTCVSWLQEKSIFLVQYDHFWPMCLLETKLADCSPQVPGESKQQDLLNYLGESGGNCNWPVIINVCRIFQFAFQ